MQLNTLVLVLAALAAGCAAAVEGDDWTVKWRLKDVSCQG